MVLDEVDCDHCGWLALICNGIRVRTLILHWSLFGDSVLHIGLFLNLVTLLVKFVKVLLTRC